MKPRVPTAVVVDPNQSAHPLQLPTCPQSMRTPCFSDLADGECLYILRLDSFLCAAYEQELKRRKFVHRKLVRDNQTSLHRRCNVLYLQSDVNSENAGWELILVQTTKMCWKTH